MTNTNDSDLNMALDEVAADRAGNLNRIRNIQTNSRAFTDTRKLHRFASKTKKFFNQATLSPSEMEHLLTQWNKFNVRLQMGKVREIQTDVLDGFWQDENGCPVLIDQDGFILSGQHRMYAFVGLDKSLTTDIISGIPSEAMDVIDNVKPRKPSDNPLLRECRSVDRMPSIHDFSFRKVAFSIAKNMLILENPAKGKKFSSRRLQAYYVQFKSAIDVAMEGIGLRTTKDERWSKRPGHRAAAALYFKHAPKKAAKFFSALYGDGVGINSPAISKLRTKLMVSSKGGNAMYDEARLTLLAIKADYTGEQVSLTSKAAGNVTTEFLG